MAIAVVINLMDLMCLVHLNQMFLVVASALSYYWVPTVITVANQYSRALDVDGFTISTRDFQKYMSACVLTLIGTKGAVLVTLIVTSMAQVKPSCRLLESSSRLPQVLLCFTTMAKTV
jgi:hypothetical protein